MHCCWRGHRRRQHIRAKPFTQPPPIPKPFTQPETVAKTISQPKPAAQPKPKPMSKLRTGSCP